MLGHLCARHDIECQYGVAYGHYGCRRCAPVTARAHQHDAHKVWLHHLCSGPIASAFTDGIWVMARHASSDDGFQGDSDAS